MSKALFINVEVDDSVANDPALAAKLAEVCPVDIFAVGENGLELVEDNLDECVLCQLCMNVVENDPTHPVRVIKLYDGGAVLGA
jgi:NAD-dependent dihydropyrimidine dehydrogenase PreA subunit